LSTVSEGNVPVRLLLKLKEYPFHYYNCPLVEKVDPSQDTVSDFWLDSEEEEQDRTEEYDLVDF
jgi:hypothetical protein